MTKFKYPQKLTQLLGVSSHTLLDDKTIYNYILNKCTKAYGTKYKIPRDLYNILNPNDSNFDSADAIDYVIIRNIDIKLYLKKLIIIDDKDKYIKVGEILSDKPIKYLEVLVV